MLEGRDKILIGCIVQRIKRLRDIRNVSQRDLYINTNVSIGRIEQGKENIKITTLLNICEELEISLSDFLKDIENEIPKRDDYTFS